MTPEQLDAIQARADAASPEPWERGYVWSHAGVVFDSARHKVGPKHGTHCHGCFHLGEPVWVGRMDINGTMMRAHRHRATEPYQPDHLISDADGGVVVGNYDYEAGGILDPADTEFVVHARIDVPQLVAEVRRLREALEALAQRGIHADTEPTLGGRLGDGRDYVRWTRYLQDADRAVRSIARAALDGGS